MIVGVNNLNTGTTNTLVYVYEVASGTVLRTRASVGQSTSLSMSPDGSRFMAGFTMFDTGSLSVIGQMDYRNAPYAQSTAFNTTANYGGSIFSPDGSTLYAAYNTASGTPLPKPSASTLMVSDPTNLAIKLGIKAPESIVAKIVATADGASAWASSESGLVHLPLANLYNYPILMPDTMAVFVAQDECNRGVASSPVKINNIGQGKLTFSVPSTSTALAASVNTGLAPSTMTLTMDPGRVTTTLRQPGTNLYNGNSGTPLAINLASAEAINIPPTIQVFMNYRLTDQRGQVYPVAVSPNGNNAQGLKDLVLDDKRNRIYISNAGKNQIEVFDTASLQFLKPLPAGQFPGTMALGTDGDTLYVANTGGESIQYIDLNSSTIAGSIAFPPVPRAATATTNYSVLAMANGLSGLQVIMSNGTQWQVIGNTLVPRQLSSIINGVANNNASTQTQLAVNGLTMTSTPDFTQAIVLAGNNVYLYDALSDQYVATAQLYSAAIQSYYGPLAAAPGGAYYMVNGLILNSSLSVIGGTTSPLVLPTNSTVSVTANRNVAALAPVNDHQFLRVTTPVRQASTSTGTDDSRAILSLVDTVTNSESLVGPLPENPIFSDFGANPNRVNIPARQMTVDGQGNAYILTLSGLTVVPLATGSNTLPTLNNQRPIVNSTDGSNTLQPGAFVTINGQNLASTAVPSGLTAPTRLGGTCVTLSDIAIPLLRTTPNQISAQLPTRPAARFIRRASPFARHRPTKHARRDYGNGEPVARAPRNTAPPRACVSCPSSTAIRPFTSTKSNPWNTDEDSKRSPCLPLFRDRKSARQPPPLRGFVPDPESETCAPAASSSGGIASSSVNTCRLRTYSANTREFVPYDRGCGIPSPGTRMPPSLATAVFGYRMIRSTSTSPIDWYTINAPPVSIMSRIVWISFGTVFSRPLTALISVIDLPSNFRSGRRKQPLRTRNPAGPSCSACHSCHWRPWRASPDRAAVY